MSIRYRIRLPRPRPCIITALELVGVDNSTMPEGRARDVVAIIENKLGDDGDGKSAEHYETHLSLTSHRVLHFAPIKPAGMLPFLWVLDVVHLQSELVPLGVLVRGAIALGDAAVRDDLVVGDGIAEAERLRDEVARVPRVIVEPRLLREIEQNPFLRARHHNPMQELGYIRSLLQQDADGLWFVDYLSEFMSGVDEPVMYLDFLDQHRRIVMRRLEASTVLDRSSLASAWLWSYHNRVLESLMKAASFADYRQNLAELRIPATSPLVYSFPPSAKTIAR